VTWLIGASALVLALLALWRLRAVSRRLDRMKQLQWELQYQVESLSAQVAGSPGRAAGGHAAGAGQPGAARPATTFVPLSSVRR
jgi:hypothetical protein